ncbi:hypothetical protein HPP92_002572 [Vanilla planifolia]|uniref:PPC domain-containing protein n=1 Tax=Vanilla planifolia TaxID=51239 RepID=A0A835S8S8_VANPL|nr:hypothetical protein HPP92_002956 [Vanilla planifolia]KAG0502500.1 hypothetical protein HPP92_002572 [Vanilla planifolia]
MDTLTATAAAAAATAASSSAFRDAPQNRSPDLSDVGTATDSAIIPHFPAAPHRPRGRPPGSKNKPKHPVIIARESPGSLRAHAVEIPHGRDVSDCLAELSRRARRGVCVLSARGCVANITLRQGSAGGIVTLHGRLEILSLLGSFLPPPAASAGLTLFLAGTQGQVVGGEVVGALVASGSVVVMAASFGNAAVERIPAIGDEEEGGGGHCNGNYIIERQGFYGLLPAVVARASLTPEFCANLMPASGRQPTKG